MTGVDFHFRVGQLYHFDPHVRNHNLTLFILKESKQTSELMLCNGN